LEKSAHLDVNGDVIRLLGPELVLDKLKVWMRNVNRKRSEHRAKTTRLSSAA
jgi:hypothetical protein